MKNVLVFACCVVGFLLIAAPTAVEHHQVFINGKPFANAVVINGQLFVSMEDFAKAAGAKVTLEPMFQLQGSKLTAVWAAEGVASKIKEVDSKHKDEFRTAIFRVVKPGEISSKVVMENGKAFIPLRDIAKAFGSTWISPPSGLRPNQSITLNGAVDGCKDCQLAIR